MSWDALVAEIPKTVMQQCAAIHLATQRTADALALTVDGLRTAATEVEARAQRTDDGLRVGTDVPQLRRSLSSAGWSGLSLREQRAVFVLFSNFSTAELRQGLDFSPPLLRTFVRALISQWNWQVDRPTWDGYAQLLAHPNRRMPLMGGLPIDASVLLRRDGPDKLAEASGTMPMPELAASLRAARLPVGELLGACLVKDLERKGHRRLRVEGDVDWLLDSNDFRGLILPHSGGRAGIRSGSDELQRRGVAALLFCRQQGSLGGQTFERVSAHLLAPDAAFGDPRLSSNRNWERIRELNPDAFDGFVRGLTQEDLAFFFRDMEAKPRGQFWLRFLNSIERTDCWLAPAVYHKLEKQLPLFDPGERAAFRRVRRLQAGSASAFCLYFRSHVVVEFSQIGHAAYLYSRSDFEKLMGRPAEIREAKDLKHRDHGERFHHFADWERSFGHRLAALGIRHR
jgi:hypothetical protein